MGSCPPQSDRGQGRLNRISSGDVILEAAPEEAMSYLRVLTPHLSVGEIAQIMEQSDLTVKDAAVDTV